MKALRIWGPLAFLSLMCLSSLGLFPSLLGQAMVDLLLGWAFFLLRVLSQINLDPAGAITGLVCLALLAVGLHVFCGWLARNVGEAADMGAPRPWPWRRTLTLVGVVVVMFVAGIAAVGIVHQTGWLLTGPEPIIDPKSGTLLYRVAKLETENNMKQIALAAHSHQDTYHKLPAGATWDALGNPQHGWLTPLLPFVEQDTLFKQIDLHVPWNHPRNATPFKTVLATYRVPGSWPAQDGDGYALTDFASNVRVIGGNASWRLKEITDGTSHTLLFGQVAENPKPWGHPFNWRDPALGLNQSPQGFGNPEKTGAYFAFADGHVKFLSNKISPDVLKALSTPNGGEQITGD